MEHPRGNDLNLSSTLESAVEQELRQRARERGLVDNRAGIRAYNEQVEKHGVFAFLLTGN
ncbi:MAG TPA: type II toxin-antitoxin system CcdA family antitoxin [Steroidobacteraceae bacterium]|jgi:antitoxin CcdA|nr:type II toxin-antitoxin system CcdA family antitoxin [Steroidobacteraceae bacterium]